MLVGSIAKSTDDARRGPSPADTRSVHLRGGCESFRGRQAHPRNAFEDRAHARRRIFLDKPLTLAVPGVDAVCLSPNAGRLLDLPELKADFAATTCRTPCPPVRGYSKLAAHA